ncbi:MAG TPA: 50S ribosome-binding GTPase [Candidatus Competibacter sp.]|nr:GTP-binding protein HSR1 [Candidatus Competibacteraceae bacterium]HRC71624.1 50S ribosome-binding GTPase [Candidatus Competibacter sp.]
MKRLIGRFDRLRLASLLVWTLPVTALVPLGTLWLWQENAFLWWLLAMVVCSALGYGFQYALRRRERRLLAAASTAADPNWSPRAETAWAAVERFADTVTSKDYPLEDGDRLWLLGQQVLDTVARHYHPQAERPLLELTVPHMLLIIERASRDLRASLLRNIPLSHQLTIGDLLKVQRWVEVAERWLNVYRAGRLVINPAGALLSELWGHLRDRGYGMAWAELQHWLLREYVRKVGYYAVELYSGRLVLTEGGSNLEPTRASRSGLQEAEQAAAPPDEPLRILVAGRASAGKSSLINALFGRLIAATDVLPDTTAALTPYRLTREGLEAALVFDTPGSDTPLFEEKALQRAALAADLILWVCPANRPDRQSDRTLLDRLREGYARRADRRQPPLLVVLTHIDQLRPSREWRPPYDLRDPSTSKATNIRAAVETAAADLAVPVDAVIPVCLAEGRLYNVDDVLWAAILARQNEANRVRFLRCLKDRQQRENWALLRQQLSNAGRWLAGLPDKILH